MKTAEHHITRIPLACEVVTPTLPLHICNLGCVTHDYIEVFVLTKCWDNHHTYLKYGIAKAIPVIMVLFP